MSLFFIIMLFFFCSLLIFFFLLLFIFIFIIPLPKNSLDYDPTKGILSKTEGSRGDIERCRTPCLISQKKETEFTLFILFDRDFLIRNREYREKKNYPHGSFYNSILCYQRKKNPFLGFFL